MKHNPLSQRTSTYRSDFIIQTPNNVRLHFTELKTHKRCLLLRYRNEFRFASRAFYPHSTQGMLRTHFPFCCIRTGSNR
jgi:hypothetical protein